MAEPVTFFFDKNCGSRLPEALKILRIPTLQPATQRWKAGMAGDREAPLFTPECPDDEWLPVVGGKGWIVVSHDEKFHKPGYESELNAIKQYSVGCFYLWGANAPAYEKARCFLKAYEKVVLTSQSTPKPFIFSVDKHAHLARIV
jgi:hypothetical protein